MVKVKICGIRSLEAAKTAIDAGAHFLGFNFVPSSKRYIKPEDALRIINPIRGKVKIVGVFQNANLDDINHLALKLGLDFVQLHGSSAEINTILSVDFFLLDRTKQGTGKMVNFKKAQKIAKKKPIFLAGGLTPANVIEAVKKVQPFAVDVAGGIETNGKQDLEKIKAFIKNAKGEL